MRSPQTPLAPPRIPDHEVLRCIGRGSYGEVWMARAVTGALRAVKVVRRVDFEMERTFEREFEGIRSFEPISRSHPGLIDILHVGRNEEEGFYFCVMELADDRYRGRSIVPAEYDPRTLSTDRKDGGKLPLDTTIEVGLLLADALAHLHKHGLIHRDVKPSNVIFMDGVAQLADIGLVAAYGQRTYVGTEGFVPPEGPGTPQADTYSLGMVLYELSTGLDRMEFPTVPDDLASLGDKKKWRALNEVICRACAPEPRDRYPHAHDMAEDLRRVLNGRRSKSRSFLRRKRFWLGSGLALFLVSDWADRFQRRSESGLNGANTQVVVMRPPEPDPAFIGPPEPPPPKLGQLYVTSEPSGAEVWIEGGKRGVTPLTLDHVLVGEVHFTLRLPQYREVTKIANIVENNRTENATALQFWSPPQTGQPWRNSQGLEFVPRGDEHVALLPTTRDHFVQAHGGVFREGEVLPWTPPGANEPSYIVFVPRRDAETYREWMETQDREKSFFNQDHFYKIEEVSDAISPTRDETTKDHLVFRLVAGLRLYGYAQIDSVPSGAAVFENGQQIGVTPLELERRLVGPVNLELRLSGFHPIHVSGEIKSSERLMLKPELERSLLAVFDQEWQNSLGQIFRPVGDLQFCIWETRVKDYATFTTQTGRAHTSDIEQGPDHPVIAVNRADAEAFCRWLTEKERREGRLENGWGYRLPSDEEWSQAAGIPNERGDTPGERNSRIRGVYPWGYVWPPPMGSGNFADQSATGIVTLDKPGDRLLSSTDAFGYTAPVGSFAPSKSGLHDVAGNVWEWVQEDFGGGTAVSNFSAYGVVRGGSWSNYNKDTLLSSFRNAVPVIRKDSNIGFRVVLARKK